MEFENLINERYSVRKFLEKEVEEDKLEELLSIINKVPTAKNLQPFKVYVLRKQEDVIKMRNITKSAYNAPLILIITYKPSEEWVNPYSNQGYGIVDASILTTYLMLKCVDLGLGSVFVGWFNEKLVKEGFNIPSEEKVVSLLPLGYLDSTYEPASGHYQKKDLKDIVTYL